MCKYGDKCQFAHGQEELRPLPRHPKYKTEPCRSFHSTGVCPYGPRCHFIHGPNDQAAAEVAAARNAAAAASVAKMAQAALDISDDGSRGPHMQYTGTPKAEAMGVSSMRGFHAQFNGPVPPPMLGPAVTQTMSSKFPPMSYDQVNMHHEVHRRPRPPYSASFDPTAALRDQFNQMSRALPSLAMAVSRPPGPVNVPNDLAPHSVHSSRFAGVANGSPSAKHGPSAPVAPVGTPPTPRSWTSVTRPWGQPFVDLGDELGSSQADRGPPPNPPQLASLEPPTTPAAAMPSGRMHQDTRSVVSASQPTTSTTAAGSISGRVAADPPPTERAGPLPAAAPLQMPPWMTQGMPELIDKF